MSNIPKSQLDAVDTRVEVMLRKLFEGRTVNFEDLNGVDILSPDDDDTLFYNFTLDLWENHSLKTINGQSLKGPGNIAISGGSGSPGGSSGQFQWNDSGAFGGTTGYTWNFGTSQPLSTNGYLLGVTSSLEEIDGGSLVTTSTTLEPISGLIASLDLISNKSTTATARLNTNSGATNKYLQVEINRSSPRYFDGTTLQDVWHTGTFDPTTKQDVITAGTGLSFTGATLNVSTNLAGWNGITTSSKQDTLVSATNIKTVNGNSLLGSGDLVISGSLPTDSQIATAVANSFGLKYASQLHSPSGDFFDITAFTASGANSAHSRAFRGASGGKWYFEVATSGSIVGGSSVVGVVQSGTDAAAQVGSGGTGSTASWGVLPNGNRYSGSSTAYGTSWLGGGVIMVAVDMSLAVGSRKIWFGLNGTWFNSGDPAAGTNEAFANLPLIVAPGVTPSTGLFRLRLRASEFSHSIPSGFSAWVT